MAKERRPEEIASAQEKKQLQAEKRQLKKEQKQQRKEAKQRAKEISKRENALAEEEEGNGLVTFGATVVVVLLWLFIVCIIIKMDIGGFGSSVLTPILKDVPVLNRILPGNSLTETTDTEAYGGYTSLADAVEQIKALELELERTQLASASKDEEIEQYQAEIIRLKEFEKVQLEFQRIQTEFYEEVVYSEKGPGEEAFQEYYESMDPATAEYIYKQVVMQNEESGEIQEYADTYAQMKPKQAAALLEAMTDNLKLGTRILSLLSSEQRAEIFDAMDPEVAAKYTKMLDPES